MKTLSSTFVSLLAPLALATAAQAADATLTLQAGNPGPVVQPEVYGHFAEHLGRCIYGGIWVGEDSDIPNTRGIRNDTVAALKALEIPVLRWPGGCFADEYHWKDGIGPREKRPAMINTHWGGVVENNHFGTHEFMELIEQLGCEAYVCGNVGSGTPQEMMEWVEYMTSPADSPMANQRRANGRDKPWKVKYFGVGNESWGCGGNMRPEYYADLYRRYNTFVKNYDRKNPIQRFACGANNEDYNWTETVMKIAGAGRMDGISLHYYTIPTGDWGKKGSSTDFAEEQWFSTLERTLRMDSIIANHSAIMDKHDPRKKVGLIVDEWGTWYDKLPGTPSGFLEQQNTLRDALVAALNFHIFHDHAERVTMANIAQTVNVLQAMILTDGPKFALTPTYWVFEMYKVHQGGTVLPVDVEASAYQMGDRKIPRVSATATRKGKDGPVHLSLVNTHPSEDVSLTCSLGTLSAKSVSGRILTAPELNSMNTFDAPESVKPVAFDGASIADSKLTLTLPAKSIVVLELR
ncbi:MAG: alpha-N-arabinofuranosidase [Akkermansiaceae bacterium]|nr:alpha-N-arabinofuranosidase [Akkermansiaceae bacterium]